MTSPEFGPSVWPTYRLPPGSLARSSAVGATSAGQAEAQQRQSGTLRRFPVLGNSFNQGRLDRPRGNAVDQHVVACGFQGQSLCESDDSGFGSTVVAEPGSTFDGQLGSDVYDAAPLLPPHLPHHLPAAQEDTRQVNRNRLVPHGQGHVFQPRLGQQARAVYENIDAPELGACGGEGAPHTRSRRRRRRRCVPAAPDRSRTATLSPLAVNGFGDRPCRCRWLRP